MAGWFDVWRPPPTRSGAATFHIANHLIELAPMWRHRLVTEETADVSSSRTADFFSTLSHETVSIHYVSYICYIETDIPTR